MDKIAFVDLFIYVMVSAMMGFIILLLVGFAKLTWDLFFKRN